MKLTSIKSFTRKEIALLYGISPRTLYNWLKRRKMKLSGGLVSPAEAKEIFDAFGWPEMDRLREERTERQVKKYG